MLQYQSSEILVVPRGGVKQCCRRNNLSCPTLRSRPIVFQGVFLTLSHRFSRLPLIKGNGNRTDAVTSVYVIMRSPSHHADGGAGQHGKPRSLVRSAIPDVLSLCSYGSYTR
jgi:hypothetical protein